MADNLQSYKVDANEISSSTKFNNLVQAAEDGLNTIDNSNVSSTAAILISKLASGSSFDSITTVAGVPTWTKGTYTSYTPTWTSTGTAPALNNGVISGYYLQLGKHMHTYGKVIFGSTSTFGTGNYLFSLPANIGTNMNFAGHPIGQLIGVDVSASSTTHFVALSQTNNVFNGVYLSSYPSGTSTNMAATAPYTWASGDIVSWNLVYETS